VHVDCACSRVFRVRDDDAFPFDFVGLKDFFNPRRIAEAFTSDRTRIIDDNGTDNCRWRLRSLSREFGSSPRLPVTRSLSVNAPSKSTENRAEHFFDATDPSTASVSLRSGPTLRRFCLRLEKTHNAPNRRPERKNTFIFRRYDLLSSSGAPQLVASTAGTFAASAVTVPAWHLSYLLKVSRL
jgi:hypothetical protein